MTYPQLQLVDAPSNTANVLFDFNDKTAIPARWYLREGFTLGSPDLDGEVDAIDPVYLDRTIVVPLRIEGTKAQATALQSTLAQRLMTGGGWLLWRLSAATQPVWFRTYRPRPGALSFENIASETTKDLWDITIEFPAEPFAYGAKVTQPVQTINNDPTHATNPMRAVLPAIVGDAPAPLRIAATPGGYYAGTRLMFSINAGVQTRYPAQGNIGGVDGHTPGVDVSAVTDSTGTAGNYRSVSFATNAALVARLSGTASLPALIPGRYKVLVRAGLQSPATVSLRMTLGLTLGRLVTLTATEATTRFAWVDLGDFELPRSPLPSSETQTALHYPTFSLEAGRTVGTSALLLDHFMFVPVGGYDVVDSRTLFAHFAGVPQTTTQQGTYDGDTDSYWARDTVASGQPVADIRPQLEGTFLRGVPGANHVLTVAQKVDNLAGDNDGLTRTYAVTVSYYPRYRWVAES